MDWRAKWITADPGVVTPPAMPVFRCSFNLDRSVHRAMMKVCGLGHHELRLNGQRVSDHVLDPGWTNYRKTCLFVVHDVTADLRAGENVIGVMLGNGMYNVMGNRYRKFKASFGPPKLILQLEIEHALAPAPGTPGEGGGEGDFVRRGPFDVRNHPHPSLLPAYREKGSDGPVTLIASDELWHVAPGPITFSCIYGGEDYDARLEQAGWDAPGFDASAWHPAMVVEGPGGELVEQTAPPLRVMRTFQTASVTESTPGTRVFDLGQNHSGWPAIEVRGASGAKVTLVTGELLDAAGAVSQKSTGGPVSFSYTLRGDGVLEKWEPRFSLTGFRYVQAAIVPGVDLLVRGRFVHADAPVVGEFRCSNELLNRTHRLINNAILSNLHSVLTDCPHREKLGWLEQLHLMGPAVMMNYDLSRFYPKVCRDMRDAQRDDGCVPTIAPEYVVFKEPWAVFSNSPEWGSAAVICPWLVYRQYGDRQILLDNYEMMRRYVAYLQTREQDGGLLNFGLADWYDIGPGDPGFSKLTSPALTATAIYYCDCLRVSWVSTRLGKSDDTVVGYEEQAERIRQAFNDKFFDPETGRYDRGSQTAQAMPLALGMVEPEHRSAVLDHLVADIRANNNHITAGDIGFFYVLKALTDAGRSDVIFDLLSRTDPPSYGSQLARGATTLTEAWDANPKNSQNHLMLGHADLWLYESLAGIRFDLTRPPTEQIVIRPAVVGDVTWAEATHDSVLGRIGSRWERQGAGVRMEVTIPGGGTAMVFLPATTSAVVTAPSEARLVQRTEQTAIYQIASPSSGTPGEGGGGGSSSSSHRIEPAPTPTLPRSTGGGDRKEDVRTFTFESSALPKQ